MFRLTSISLGASSIAVINGQRCIVGETLGVRSGGRRADVRVDAVEDGYALLSCGSQHIRVDLEQERPRQKPRTTGGFRKAVRLQIGITAAKRAAGDVS